MINSVCRRLREVRRWLIKFVNISVYWRLTTSRSRFVTALETKSVNRSLAVDVSLIKPTAVFASHQ